MRADTMLALAQNADGTFTGYGPNLPRVGVGLGLLCEPQIINRLKWNRDFTNAVWTTSNLTLSGAGENPIVGSQPFNIVDLAVGTTSWTVPAGVTSITAIALGPGGHGANGTTNTNAGGGGGGGALAITSNISVTPGDVLTVQVSAGGSGAATFLKTADTTTRVSADFGTNASGATAGAGGLVANSVGTIRRAGGNGGGGSSGTNNRGGGGGGGAGDDSTVGGVNGNGKGGNGGNGNGGGGGGSLGGGVTNATGATAGVGGTGGTNTSNTGGGSGGTAGAAAGNGSEGGGGGGGVSGTGINGGNGGSFTWTLTSGTLTQTVSGGGGGAGGGGGFAGNGGNGGAGAGGGGGGSTNAAAGTKGTGGDGKLVITYGAAYATRVTATANNASLSQTYTASALMRTPSLVIRPVNATGAVYLSQDGGSTQTDISGQLRAGRWVQAFAPNDSIVNPTWQLTIANSGDVLDIDLAQLEDNESATSPIPTTNALPTRHQDLVTLNTASFPTFLSGDALTVLMTVMPKCQGTSIGGSVTNTGWTWLHIAGLAASVGDITASITGTVMTVTDHGSVTLAPNQKVTGVGVTDNTFIGSQASGTTGQNGDYNVSPSQTVGSETITIVGAEGYVCNAVDKGGGDLQTGVTLVHGATGLNFGFDPLTAQYSYFQWNRVGFSATSSTRSSTTALKGDARTANQQSSWPDHSLLTTVQIGSKWPTGTASLTGYVAELTILNIAISPSALQAWTRQAVSL